MIYRLVTSFVIQLEKKLKNHEKGNFILFNLGSDQFFRIYHRLLATREKIDQGTNIPIYRRGKLRDEKNFFFYRFVTTCVIQLEKKLKNHEKGNFILFNLSPHQFFRIYHRSFAIREKSDQGTNIPIYRRVNFFVFWSL